MKHLILFTLFSGALLLSSCNCNKPETQQRSATPEPDSALAAHVITAAEQAALTPGKVLIAFKEGNKRFIANRLTHYNFPDQVRKSADGQYPEAVILSCMDSRVPPEYIFDKSIGDLFVIRVAGNIIDKDILGSMEYACKESGAKLIIVMGHHHCGAVKAAINNVKLGNITGLLQKIKPALDRSSNFDGDKSVKNDRYLDEVCLNNVMVSINQIKAQSPILKEMALKGEIKIVGALYELKTGVVMFLE